MVRVDTRKEVLRLYREILRTSRRFHWKNEQGEEWSKVLQKNARMEIEGARYETDRETISKRLIVGWECVKEVRVKFEEKENEILRATQPTDKQ
uniref:Complex 1 LYR protein domain-containing protein n=1 Tax=Globisporangium ultimum (strain ATCC 200006 / CBS 805.95 / DAOM BR144) TaxID=431595 RepID=K3WW08_GLOUD